MTETTRTEAFSFLAELARCYPNWRIGQLIANLAGWADSEVWDVEDDQLLAAAKAHLAAKFDHSGDHLNGKTSAVPSNLTSCGGVNS